SAVLSAHKAGLLIKELNPANIAVRPNGSICFIDIDSAVPLNYQWTKLKNAEIPELARVTYTLLYCENISPISNVRSHEERLAVSEKVFRKPWDIFSFGVILAAILQPRYFMPLLNKPQEKYAATQREINVQASRWLTPGARVTPAARASFSIVQKCLFNRDQAQNRYQDMEEVIDDIKKVQQLVLQRTSSSVVAVARGNRLNAKAGREKVVFPVSSSGATRAVSPAGQYSEEKINSIRLVEAIRRYPKGNVSILEIAGKLGFSRINLCEKIEYKFGGRSVNEPVYLRGMVFAKKSGSYLYYSSFSPEAGFYEILIVEVNGNRHNFLLDLTGDLVGIHKQEKYSYDAQLAKLLLCIDPEQVNAQIEKHKAGDKNIASFQEVIPLKRTLASSASRRNTRSNAAVGSMLPLCALLDCEKSNFNFKRVFSIKPAPEQMFFEGLMLLKGIIRVRDRIRKIVSYLQLLDDRERRLVIRAAVRCLESIDFRKRKHYDYEYMYVLRHIARNMEIEAARYLEKDSPENIRMRRHYRGVAYLVEYLSFRYEEMIYEARESINQATQAAFYRKYNHLKGLKIIERLASLPVYHEQFEADLRALLKGKNLKKMEPEGSKMIAYSAPDIGFAVKFLKDDAKGEDGKPVSFYEIIPGVDLAKERLGGLATDTVFVENLELTIQGKRVIKKNALVQRKVTILRDKIRELVNRKKYDEVKNILRNWFELQKRMWARRVLDQDIKLLYNYGYDEASREVVLFDFTDIFSNREKYFVEPYTSCVTYHNIANVTCLNDIKRGLGSEYMDASYWGLNASGKDFETIWPEKDMLHQESFRVPMSEPSIVSAVFRNRIRKIFDTTFENLWEQIIIKSFSLIRKSAAISAESAAQARKEAKFKPARAARYRKTLDRSQPIPEDRPVRKQSDSSDTSSSSGRTSSASVAIDSTARVRSASSSSSEKIIKGRRVLVPENIELGL
ncbi:MAG: hypothetical protein PHT53_04300, partial [Candidatus Omnitrophica bacterium]|nr:hypothetical protein [Candidatus Omnitrophota bacterium]